MRLLLGGHWKAKQIWERLDRRCGRPEYERAPLASCRPGGCRAVVVGAGPIGLRAAIELALLGAHVTLVEQRTRFTRINRLHLWQWCGEELKDLGARCLEPPPADFGADPDILHIGINEVQCLLFKVALLLGVSICLGVEYEGVEWQDGTAGGWAARMRCVASAADTALCCAPAAGDQAQIRGISVLIGAGGLTQSDVGKSVSLESTEVGNLRQEGAIGLV